MPGGRLCQKHHSANPSTTARAAAPSGSTSWMARLWGRHRRNKTSPMRSHGSQPDHRLLPEELRDLCLRLHDSTMAEVARRWAFPEPPSTTTAVGKLRTRSREAELRRTTCDLRRISSVLSRQSKHRDAMVRLSEHKSEPEQRKVSTATHDFKVPFDESVPAQNWKTLAGDAGRRKPARSRSVCGWRAGFNLDKARTCVIDASTDVGSDLAHLHRLRHQRIRRTFGPDRTSSRRVAPGLQKHRGSARRRSRGGGMSELMTTTYSMWRLFQLPHGLQVALHRRAGAARARPQSGIRLGHPRLPGCWHGEQDRQRSSTTSTGPIRTGRRTIINRPTGISKRATMSAYSEHYPAEEFEVVALEKDLRRSHRQPGDRGDLAQFHLRREGGHRPSGWPVFSAGTQNRLADRRQLPWSGCGPISRSSSTPGTGADPRHHGQRHHLQRPGQGQAAPGQG